eukprot:comp88524_c0_seq1/m.48529 comp88524_c0_seq1/g.48529  ORF comp88524_c0_seq1/g.48529 comp88524_c0_seq1/m.48529 type:complete len:193 (-) comp88524_c0_seq1:60-638(-)
MAEFRRPCAILTVGIPGCGKTSHVMGPMFAGFVNVNRDDVRKERLGNVNDHGAEDEITQICKAKMTQAMRENKNLVVSDTNINPRHRSDLVRYLYDMGFNPIIAHVFNVSGRTCLERNRTRDKPVPPEVIERMEDQIMSGLPQLGRPSQGLFDDVIIIHQQGAIPLMPNAPGATTNTTASLAGWNTASSLRR